MRAVGALDPLCYPALLHLFGREPACRRDTSVATPPACRGRHATSCLQRVRPCPRAPAERARPRAAQRSVGGGMSRRTRSPPGACSESPISTAAPPPNPPARKKSSRTLSGVAIRATPSPRPVISASESYPREDDLPASRHHERPWEAAPELGAPVSGASRGAQAAADATQHDNRQRRRPDAESLSPRPRTSDANRRRQRHRAGPTGRSRRARCAPSRDAPRFPRS